MIGYVNQRNDSVISNCTVPITIGSIQMPPEYGKVFTIAPHPITESLHLYLQQSMNIHSLSLVSPIGEIYSLDLMKIICIYIHNYQALFPMGIIC